MKIKHSGCSRIIQETKSHVKEWVLNNLPILFYPGGRASRPQ